MAVPAVPVNGPTTLRRVHIGGPRIKVLPVTSSRQPEELTVREPAVMRAMAHPARLAILDYLSDGRSATATECAHVCGLSPSATSYHLRELAKAGLIEEAPSRGDGRERVWRSPPMRVSVDLDDPDSPEARHAALALMNSVLAHEDAQARRWLARASEETGEWSDAAIIMRKRLIMTADELKTLMGRLNELLSPYSVRRREDPPAGARRVAVQLRMIPTDEVAD
jgi:DNA-binding transcriptional ArsR family regulator